MAGRKQHHIPRMVLRGFTLPAHVRVPKVQVYSKQNSYPDSVGNVAAERHFYSELSFDGTKTLDDLITDYESRFATKFFHLRDLPVGSAADGSISAEVVAHLTIRNAYVRSTLSDGVASIFERAIGLFCNEENLRRLLGVDAKELPERMRKYLDENFLNDPRFKATGLPPPFLYKISFMAMRENFNQFIMENLPSFLGALQYASSEAPKHTRRGHNAILTEGLEANERAALLRDLTWSIESAPAEGSILPDCVALGFEGGSAPQPLFGVSLTKVDYVVCPLTPSKLLVGKRLATATASFSDFNKQAAACSHSFFVSHRTGVDLDGLMPTIGKRPRESLEEAINSAFHVFTAENLVPENEIDFSADESPTGQDAISAELKQAHTTYSITFKGIVDEETAQRIGAIIQAIVTELKSLMPLDRIDGFTFAADYEGALQEFDRGIQTAEPLTAGQFSYGTSVGMTPLVVRDGIAKGHVFARIEIATGLISEDEETKGGAFHLVIRQLAHVAYIQLVEEALPGAHAAVLNDNYEAFLFPHVETGWSGYFGARASALFAPRFGAHYLTLLTSAMKEAQSEILSARLAYRFDGDLDRFLGVALGRVGAVLSFTGQYLGHYDGLGRDAFEDEEANNLFEQAGLRAWADLFRQDLASVWDRRGVWKSFDEFLLLNRHAERVLWQFGVFPWKTPDGQIRIEVPLISDARDLTGIRPALRGLFWRIRRSGQKALARIRRS